MSPLQNKHCPFYCWMTSPIWNWLFTMLIPPPGACTPNCLYVCITQITNHDIEPFQSCRATYSIHKPAHNQLRLTNIVTRSLNLLSVITKYIQTILPCPYNATTCLSNAISCLSNAPNNTKTNTQHVSITGLPNCKFITILNLHWAPMLPLFNQTLAMAS